MRSIRLSVPLALACAAAALAADNLTSDWSDATNPFGPWSMNEGADALPFVAAWQATLGGWTQPQPGWASSSDGNNRLPFFFKSNGSEVFGPDWAAGDVVCHSWDATNGAGNEQARAVWTASQQGVVHVSGNVWLGRDIGRAVDWSIEVNNSRRTGGSLFDGDPYSSANPFNLASGDGGPSSLRGVIVLPGDQVALRLDTISFSGDFVVIDNLTVQFIPIACFGDANNDGLVNFTDLNFVLSNFGQSGPAIPGDLNLDDVVNFTDLNLVLSNFAVPCPTHR